MKVVFYDESCEELFSFDSSATWVCPRHKDHVRLDNGKNDVWYEILEIEHNYTDIKNPVLEIRLTEY